MVKNDGPPNVRTCLTIHRHCMVHQLGRDMVQQQDGCNSVDETMQRQRGRDEVQGLVGQ